MGQGGASPGHRSHPDYVRRAANGGHPLTVRAGEFVCNTVVAQKLVKRTAHRHSLRVNSAEHLTGREVEVLELAAKVMSNRDIAAQFGIGPYHQAPLHEHFLEDEGRLSY